MSHAPASAYPASSNLRFFRRPGPSAASRARGGSVTLPVRDLDRAVAFYCGGLGLSLRLRVGDAWAEVETDGLTLCLLRSKQPELASSSGPAIGLEVTDLTAALAELESRGAAGDAEVRDDGSVRCASLTDPDGNRLYVCQVLHGPGRHPTAFVSERRASSVVVTPRTPRFAR